MRKIILSSVITMAMGTVSVAGYAAESASMAITGTITPGTCDVSLSAASIDFGNIIASTLTSNINNKLGDDITVRLSCAAPTAVALQTTDNRASSAMTIAEATEQMAVIIGAEDVNLFGLGTDSASQKVGVLLMGIKSTTLNGSASTNLLSSSDMSTWTRKVLSPTTGVVLAKDGYFASASTTADTAPVAVTNATYTIGTGIALKKSDKYPSGEIVNLDGNVTFSVVYL